MIQRIDNEWLWGKDVTLLMDNKGMVEIQFEDGCEWGYICDLKVADEHRHQGIATALMEKCEDIIKEQYEEAQLRVEKEREWQMEWYKRLGYKVIQTDNNYYTLRKLL